jgi:hypothetical protein
MSHEEGFEADLVVLVPDRTFRAAMTILLTRHESLGIRRITAEVFQQPEFDPGSLKGSADYLRQFLPTHAHAIVLFDKEGCGREGASAEELEAMVQKTLDRSGWEGRAEVVVVDPELEVWVWSDSSEVDRCLGWAGRQPGLREWLRQQHMWDMGAPKPRAPKSALAIAVRAARRGASPPVLVQLARSIGLRRCTDRAFVRFREILQQWFPVQPRQTT